MSCALQNTLYLKFDSYGDTQDVYIYSMSIYYKNTIFTMLLIFKAINLNVDRVTCFR